MITYSVVITSKADKDEQLIYEYIKKPSVRYML